MNSDEAHNTCRAVEEREDGDEDVLVTPPPKPREQDTNEKKRGRYEDDEGDQIFMPSMSGDFYILSDNTRCPKEVYRRVGSWSRDFLIEQYIVVSQMLIDATAANRIPELPWEFSVLNGKPSNMHTITTSKVQELRLRLLKSLEHVDAELNNRHD
jgi:hypothetical protein